MPAIGVEADAELERAAVADVGGDVVRLGDLLAVVPHLEVARAVALPADLELDAVPDAGGDGGEVLEAARDLAAGRADVAVLDARRELVALEPHHGGRHVRLGAPEVGEVGDELRQVVALRRRELPVLLQPEREPVEPRVPLLVHVVLDRLRVVPPRPAGVVHLRHLERRAALVHHVRHLLHRALVLVRVRVPPGHGARVAEDLRRLCDGGGAQGAEKMHG